MKLIVLRGPKDLGGETSITSSDVAVDSVQSTMPSFSEI
jgi:hypothetical protein